MKQYCRYCSFCIPGDCYFCTDHQKVLADGYVRSENRCKDFDLSPLGDVDTGKQYKPRERKMPLRPDGKPKTLLDYLD